MKLSPFKKLLITVGNLPTAYIESMSYYEGLCYLVNYIVNNIDPNVKQNTEGLEELQNYVNNYFDNLDVQDEINEKLDEMASGGELENIISAYLNINAVIGYNTKADLKASLNLANGVKCKTLGTSSATDGFGEYYLIRNKTVSDVVDDNNIVALTNFNDLIAQKIPDYYNNILNINIFETPTLINSTDASDISINSLNIARNSDGSIYKFYGYLKFISEKTGYVSLAFSSNLRPTESYTMIDTAICFNADNLCNNSIQVATDGTITLSVYVVDTDTPVFVQLPASLYFNKAFGD